jgi:hypothetical protein
MNDEDFTALVNDIGLTLNGFVKKHKATANDMFNAVTIVLGQQIAYHIKVGDKNADKILPAVIHNIQVSIEEHLKNDPEGTTIRRVQ